MSEETAAVIQREGEITVSESEDTGEETPAAPQADKDNQGGDTPSAEGDNTRTPNNEPPFHEHPRWLEREEEWKTRFNDQERRHQEDMKMVLDRIGKGDDRPVETSAPVKMPSWFGGTQEQWDAYRADLQTDLKAVEERAEKRVLERFAGQASQEETAVKEATDFLHAEIAAIQADRALNPTGEKIDAEKLFKIVYDNQLVDTKGRWNYRAGFRLMKAGDAAPAAPAKPPAETRARKEAAAGTVEGGRPEQQPKNYTTSKDFEKDRPW